MILQLQRELPTGPGISGTLTWNGALLCYTLEPTDLAIKAGAYRVELTKSGRVEKGKLWSPRPPFLPELFNVPGREAIRIHSGNWYTDTEGCILVGNKKALNAVFHSHDALTALVAIIVDPCGIEIKDGRAA